MKSIIMLLMLSFCLSSCTTTDRIPIDIKSKNINNQIELTIIPEWNSYKKGDPITISIKNTTNEMIIFPYDYGVRIFIYFDGSWVEVQDKEMLTEKESILIPPGSTHHYSIFGDFPLQQNDILVRIYSIGQIENNEKRVAGYLEIKLH